MQISILGPLDVRVGETAIALRRGLPRALVVWLALRARETVAVDVLVDRLWGDDPPASPVNALQLQVSYLRKALRAADPSAAGVLATRAGGYALDVPDDAIDARAFEALVAAAGRALAAGDADGARRLLDDALARWRGDPLSEIAGHPAAAGEITRLGELHLTAVEARVDALLALGRHDDLVPQLHQLVAEHPLRERLHGQLMLALYRAGRQADALRAFEHVRTTLADELGLDPGPDLRALEARILAHAPDLRAGATVPAGAGAASPAPVASVPVAGAPGPAANTALEPVPAPTPMTSLVGRADELERLAAVLGRTRLLTLTGPGGAGKTRLALELAARSGLPTWFVDLGDIAADDLVSLTVATRLSLATPPEQDAVDLVVDALAGAEGVLLLDTCEHVLRGTAALVTAVLRRAPAVRVVATSRRPLALTGELAWPVPPLGFPAPDCVTAAQAATFPAVELFRQRADAARRDFTLDDRNAGDVAAICLLLDGLPLAIELAAAHVDALSVSEIRKRLDDRFGLLVADAVDAAERQRTLRAAIDWSAQLMSAEERRFLASLSVFSGSFTLAAASAVTGEDDDATARLVRSLVRQSMVTVHGDERYRLLDSIRSYARETLAPGDERRARTRHAEYHAGVAEVADRMVRTPEQEAWVATLRDDLGNIRAALDWSFSGGDAGTGVRLVAALAWFWLLEGMLTEAKAWLERAEAVEHLSPWWRARVLHGAAMLASPLGDMVHTRVLAARAVDAAREAGGRSLLAAALINLGVVQWACGDLDAAAASHDEAIAVARRRGATWTEAMALGARARTATDAGDLDLAARLLDDARAATDRVGEPLVLAHVLECEARLTLERGDLDGATRLAGDSLAHYRARGYGEGVSGASHLLGMVAVERGDAASARRHFHAALATAAEVGLAGPICQVLEGLALAADLAGDPAAAARLLRVATEERAARHLAVRGADRPRVDALRARVADERPSPASVPTVLAELLGR